MVKKRDKKDIGVEVLDWFVLILSVVTLLYWISGKGLFYNAQGPNLSPLTSFSLVLMVIARLASRYISTWSHPMTLALLGLVSCGNMSSLLVHMTVPELFLQAAPGLVPTSIMTSLGLVLLCLYEILVELRPSPRTAFILDDVLLHLALFPGGLSLLGYLIGVEAYRSSSLDPRVGVSFVEIILMAAFTLSSVLSNPNLFLWAFLKKSKGNILVFSMLFINQYVVAFLFGFFLRSPALSSKEYGIEFYIMLAGVMTTLVFLAFSAYSYYHRKSKLNEI